MNNVQGDFFATLVDEWVRNGVTDAVVAPGNRSTLLAAMLQDDPRVRVHVIVDERSASFFALGLARATGRPPVVWTTSGTAAAELHAAAVEAHHDQVPLLLCTADRPPELLHGRDWQAIDQSRLYDGLMRWQFDPGVADPAMTDVWRSIASRSVSETLHNPCGPGPVHLNLPIREPWTLGGTPAPGRQSGAPWHQSVSALGDGVVDVEELRGLRGVLVAGRGAGSPDLIAAAAEALGWPLLADFRSGCLRPGAIGAGEWLSPAVFPQSLQPELVVHLGAPLVSKTFGQWCRAGAAQHWIVDPHGSWFARTVTAHRVVRVQTDAFLRGCARITQKAPDDYRASWSALAHEVQEVQQRLLDTDALHEAAVARALVAALPEDGNLFVATSMPVRDAEAFGVPRTGLQVHANRGASGMDGMISTAAGIAVGSGRPTAMLCGDLSFLYDVGAMWSLKGTAAPIDLVMVVVDNGGGGIFAKMPQLQALDPASLERVALTPHSEDLSAVASSFGVGVRTIAKTGELPASLDAARREGGKQLIYVPVDRDASIAARQAVNDAVTESARRFA